jgi:hypothetical protein
MWCTDYCCDWLLISHCKIAGKSMTNRTMCFISLNSATDKGFMIPCETPIRKTQSSRHLFTSNYLWSCFLIGDVIEFSLFFSFPPHVSLLRIFRVVSHQCKRRWKWWKGCFLSLLFKTTGQITLMFPSTVAQGSDPRGRTAGPKDFELMVLHPYTPLTSHLSQLGLGYSCILQFLEFVNDGYTWVLSVSCLFKELDTPYNWIWENAIDGHLQL